MIKLFSTSLAFAVLFLVTRAGAQDSAADIRTFHPRAELQQGLATGDFETPGPLRVAMGTFLTVQTPSLLESAPISNVSNGAAINGNLRVVGAQFIADPWVSLGLGDVFSIGVTMPFVLAQEGQMGLPERGYGNLGVFGKWVARRPDPSWGGFGISFSIGQTLSTGNRASYMGGTDPSQPGWLFRSSETLVFADGCLDLLRILRASVSLGFVHRWDPQNFVAAPGDRVMWGLSVSLSPKLIAATPFTLQPSNFWLWHWTWSLEIHGEINVTHGFFYEQFSPVFVGLSARKDVSHDVTSYLGIETSLDQSVGAPRARLVFSLEFGKPIVDDDHDGFPDDEDDCPGIPGPNQGCP